MYSRQLSMITFASARLRNHSRFRHSSLNFPLKRSSNPFCQGLPGSIRAVLICCRTSYLKMARETNSDPMLVVAWVVMQRPAYDAVSSALAMRALHYKRWTRSALMR